MVPKLSISSVMVFSFKSNQMEYNLGAPLGRVSWVSRHVYAALGPYAAHEDWHPPQHVVWQALVLVPSAAFGHCAFAAMRCCTIKLGRDTYATRLMARQT
ncbi:hypothetical protein HAX54_012476 [Datura stramonium]|uniref:Uncharacterized protein n=1 Tax=Datura stramonium TaxID=4076 RepID=A0ABS8TJU7_DATST|nr:hypothetical protein [Datura stramonium]